jgi:hypothetical protein
VKKFIISIFSSLLFFSTPSAAVEFGQDAPGDPNAVKVGGASGFLYSERIVITVGHVIESSGGLERWEREGVIHNPGIVSVYGEKAYKVKKVLVPETYVTPDYRNNIIIDDLAIIILSEDIPMTKRAVLATEEQMKRFVKEKSKVELVGYGVRSGSERYLLDGRVNNRPPNKLTSTLISPEQVIEFYKKYEQFVDWKKINKPGVYGIVQHRELNQSQICDGDSGSVFFVEEDNVRYVLGTTGLGLIYNNCPPPVRSYPYPSMSWIDPKSKLADLLKTAEKIVEEDKKREFAQAEEIRLAAELKAKQEAEAQAKAKAEADAKALAEAKAKADAEAAVLAKQLAEAQAATIKKNQDIARKLYAGKPCNKLKSTKSIAELKFTCIKKGKKLVWNSGVVINN